MRKILLAIFTMMEMYGVASRYERHNIFLGVGVGMDHQSYFNDNAFAWNIFGGYEFKPIRQIGLMAYLESLMGIKPYELTTRIMSQFSINMDVSLEFLPIKQYARIGPYLGVGFGYAGFSTSIDDKANSTKILFLTNAGLQMSVDESNIVRLGVKMSFELEKVRTDAMQVIVSYAYKF